MNKQFLRFNFFLLVCLLPLTATAQVVNMPDPNLRTAIETELGKTSGAPITADAMATLTHLGARNANISDLTGLEGATNLKSLRLGGNSISDIAPVTGLTNLKVLSLWANSISDISPVEALTNLTELNLSGNLISDISPVADLNQLTLLHLQSNRISDIAALASLTNLTALRLDRNSISDISVLSKLIQLTELRLDRNSLTDLSPLVANTGLRNGDTVDVRENPLSSTSIKTHIPILQSRGVTVEFDDVTHWNFGEPRTVRMIYFLPNDRPYRADVVQRMKDEIRNIQTFYAEQMQTHGYGSKTFRVETDSQGEPMVHRVDGQHPNSHYFYYMESKVRDEIVQTFNLDANLYLIVMDTDVLRRNNGQPHGGTGHRYRKIGGYALVSGGFRWETVAHELGHAFGLFHDFNDSVYIMSYGSDPNQLSACHAEYLVMNPYFNPDVPIEVERSPVIELISPRTYPAGSKSVPIQLKISDSEGLHQMILFATTRESHAAGVDLEVKTCRGLAGKKEAIVEFDYDGVIPSDSSTSLANPIAHPISVEVVDTDGNVTQTDFVLFSEVLQPLMKISGDNQTGLPNTPLPVPFVIEVRNLNDGSVRSGVSVTFTITAGEGTPNVEHTNTDYNGRAESTLTLGQHLGTTTVEASAAGIEGTVTFTAMAGAAVDLPGPNLRTAIETALGVAPGDPIAPAEMATLTRLTASNANISDLTGLEFATNLTTLELGPERVANEWRNSNAVKGLSPLAGLSYLTSLHLPNNSISDISAVANLSDLTWLHLSHNNISDLSPLVANTGLGKGDKVYVRGNPLSYLSIHTHIPTLKRRGVTVEFDNRTLATPLKISGDDQQGTPGTALERPFVVEVRDASGSAFEGVPVTFTVTAGGGTLSATRVTTDRNGRAESTLTLGPIPGTNTVTVSVAGIQEGQTFNAEGIGVPKTLEIVSGDDQEGLPGAALDNPFVVEVREQIDKPLPDAQVTFSVTSGGGTLSLTSATTDSSGRAESTLTLGPNLGTNTVSVSVTGIQAEQTFTAEGIRIPLAFWIISGNKQQGLPGEALAKPFVVEVRDQSGEPLPGVLVTFSVSSGEGNLSVTSTTTDKNGRAESTLTLGPNPGTNTVTVSVTGIQAEQTFTAEGIRTPQTIRKISGDAQEGLPGVPLDNPFVVEVRDQTDKPLPDAQVTFSVTSGGGTLSGTNATTDSNGRAESTLTLGPNPGTNTVSVSVTGIQAEQTFNAEGIRTPTTLEIVSEDDQEGQPGAALDNPFVVEVRDQTDKPLPDAQVTFSVTSGGGTLSLTSATTDSNGRAESTLTLGPAPGTNTVTVSAAEIQEDQTFFAEGIRIPLAFWIISGDKQQGLLQEALAKPFVVEVRDRSSEPLPGVLVTFSVTSGGGTLSVTSATTESGGRAESILTLGPNPGTNTVEVGVTGIQERQSVSAIAELPPIPQDVNRDDIVNILDLVMVASDLGDEGADLMADVNRDGVVNILDLVLVAGALGNVAAAPSANPRALAMLTAKDVGHWLVQAGELELTEATSQRGVLFLEQLLAALTPKETALLPNYPNPFNPETWIPYQLSEDADVTLTIYDTNGVVVRRLDLGHKSAGFYESQSQTIHWDGRNDFGEGVASGVYFYQLATPSFRQIRRMVILK